MDNNLIKLAQQGEKTAMEILYRETINFIYRYVISSVNDKDLTDDIVSDIYIKAFSKIKNFRGESSFKTWIHTIARNEIYTYYKQKKLSNKFISFDEDYMTENAEENNLNNKTSRIEYEIEDIDKTQELYEDEREKKALKTKTTVKEILERLSPRYAEILRLRYLSEMSVKECSQYLKITENNVKVLQNRAIKHASKLFFLKI